jgi:ankyrin repeat protein
MEEFIKYIETCDLDKIKEEYHNSNKVVFHENIEELFRISCTNGNLDKAKWLWQLSVDNKLPIDINALDEYINTIFNWCCAFGKLDVAKWLWQLSLEINNSINIYHKDRHGHDAFRWCCVYGQLETAKWLLELSKDINLPIDIICKYKCYDPFRLSCGPYGNIEMTKWLWNFYESENDRDGAFIWCCENNNREFVEWLSQKYQKYKITIADNNIIDYSVIMNTNEMKQ